MLLEGGTPPLKTVEPKVPMHPMRLLPCSSNLFAKTYPRQQKTAGTDCVRVLSGYASEFESKAASAC
jgi:hypothetical protein